MSVALLLCNPKFAFNVGGGVRACATFGAETLRWTGDRVPPPEDWPEGARLPREERMYHDLVDYSHTADPKPITSFVKQGYTPVAIEVKDHAESLLWFEHPDKALYVFGPEDSSLARGTLKACHTVVTIPTIGCMNLAVAASVVLYDRLLKMERVFDWGLTSVDQPLERGGI